MSLAFSKYLQKIENGQAKPRELVMRLGAFLIALVCYGIVLAEGSSAVFWRSVDAKVVALREECLLKWPERGALRERKTDCREAETLESASRTHAYKIDRKGFIALEWRDANDALRTLEVRRFSFGGDFDGLRLGEVTPIRVLEGDDPTIFKPRSVETLVWLFVGGSLCFWFALPGRWGMTDLVGGPNYQVSPGAFLAVRRFVGSWAVYGVMAGGVLLLLGLVPLGSALYRSMNSDVVLAKVARVELRCSLGWRLEKESLYTRQMDCSRANAIKNKGLAPRLRVIERNVYTLEYTDGRGRAQRIETGRSLLADQGLRQGEEVLAMASRHGAPSLRKPLAEQFREADFSFLKLGAILMLVCLTLCSLVGLRRKRDDAEIAAELLEGLQRALAEKSPARRRKAQTASSLSVSPVAAVRRGGKGLFS